MAVTVSLPGLVFDIQVSQIHAAYPKRSEEDGSYVKQKPAHSWYDLLLPGVHLRWQLQCVKCETQGPCLISVPKPHVGQRNMTDVTKRYLFTDEHRATKSTSWYQIWLPQIRAGTPVSSWSCLHPADRRENCKSSSVAVLACLVPRANTPSGTPPSPTTTHTHIKDCTLTHANLMLTCYCENCCWNQINILTLTPSSRLTQLTF